jgi:cytochrome c oxidase cbb3-type subunit 2
MIRPFRDETERYGHYSLAAESMYDHPFQWGSERTGPDLARVGGKYSDAWHVQHLTAPRSASCGIDHAQLRLPLEHRAEGGRGRHDEGELKALKLAGVPYTQDDIAKADDDLKAQATGNGTDLAKRYAKAQARDFDGKPDKITEMDALVAYLQVLGTMVDVDSAAAQEHLAQEKGR